MRLKKEPVLSFAWNNDDRLPKIVQECRAKYRGISGVLDKNPWVLDQVHQDLRKLSRGGGGGRKGDFTSETILRALVFHAIEGLSLRETVVRLAESDFLQDFLRTRKKAVMDFTFLDRCFKAISPQTWKRINETLGQGAAGAGQVDPSKIRTDTTAVETNIHWPTDSSLLWDTYRVAARLLSRGRKLSRQSCPHRFHVRKIKGLHLFITRYRSSKSKRRLQKVRSTFRVLIERVEVIVAAARDFCAFCRGSLDFDLLGIAEALRGYLPAMQTVVANARRAAIAGEKVPARQRVFSLFEPHTELIKRGRREKPTEFGHMMLLSQTPEKFITDYEVMAERVADCELTGTVMDRHKQLFGKEPEVLAGDKGFCPAAEKYAELESRVGTLAIPRRMQDFVDDSLRHWQAFRAGIEGTISGLKRAFRLARCFYRGFKSFAASIGLAVFSHNLIVLAKTGGG
jgi:IS5 family transposase